MRRIIWIVAILFVCMNVLFVVKDKDGKVDRTVYIKDWTEVEQKDMYEKLETDGVLDYVEEQLVYLDEDSGMFNEFSVEEGDVVYAGDALYTYEVKHYYDMKLKLDSEAERLEGEIKSVQAAVDKMQNSNVEQSVSRFVYPDETEAASIPSNTSSAEMIREQYIIEKEKELGQLEAQLESVETQVADLVGGESTITVSSPYDGKVTMLSKTLANPIITIESTELHVTGELAENERMKVEEDMFVDIELVEDMLDVDANIEGMVHHISEEPKKVALKGKSVYPFEVTFNEESDDLDDEIDGSDEDGDEIDEVEINETDESDEVEEEDIDNLLQGYHAKLDITLEESLDALVVNKKVVHDGDIWQMTPAGKLLKQPIEEGLHMEQFIEVTEGAEKLDWIAEAKDSKFKDEATFITSLKPSKASWKEIYKNGPRKRSIVIGLLGR